ncbi:MULTISPECIES: hypothetical protein [unclassified Marinobacter]|uniref:hypothetical protein n=1 Tax=unclassified Marinobacter TaxID=83889 RepID=UPI0012690BA6|nr:MULTISPECIES: hypothetical protein [unclassified Marinobacter]QFS87616.1 hypothetical protein FIV08_12355 [Marinobacter sp. THAF197a]QFT51401.1 hypothetical protein FIU96_12270 [Marinobacter sp. THAF39]
MYPNMKFSDQKPVRPIWMVVNSEVTRGLPGYRDKLQHAPKAVHYSRDTAEAEAMRLAKENPGTVFFILEATEAVTCGVFKTSFKDMPVKRRDPF